MSDSAREHDRAASEDVRRRPIGIAALTISDTRDATTDLSGPVIRSAAEDSGCEVIDHGIVRDEPDAIRAQITAWVARSDVEVIITTGGTGFARRDTTVDVVRSMVSAEIDGFGEVFRRVSYDAIGAPAMLSRAMAGMIVAGSTGTDTFIFVLPGSKHAVKTAMSLVAPILGHLVVGRR